MNLIILILANDTHEYLEMQKLWKIYMHTHSNIKSFFIKYNNLMEENIILDNDTIYVKGNESLIPGCLDKTIKSIEYVLNNFEFDFILRTNMSSVFDLQKFYNLLNKDLICGGIIGIHEEKKYISGAGMLLSKDLCSNLISNKNSLNYNIIDDLSIGEYIRNNNYFITPFTRFEAYNYINNLNEITNEQIYDYYHFRCKCNDFNNTILLMQKIINLIN